MGEKTYPMVHSIAQKMGIVKWRISREIDGVKMGEIEKYHRMPELFPYTDV